MHSAALTEKRQLFLSILYHTSRNSIRLFRHASSSSSSSMPAEALFDYSLYVALSVVA